MNSNCSNLLDMRNLQEQVKKAFCYQKLFWPFTVWINCSSDLKNFANSRPSASNFKSFSRSLEQFFLTVGQNNFGNKIPFFNPMFLPKTLYVKWTSTLNLMLRKKWYNIKSGFPQTGKESLNDLKIGWHPSWKMDFLSKFT